MNIYPGQKCVCTICPSPENENPRNSEGDFIRLKDGSILFAYSRYKGTSWDDSAPSDIAAVFSFDGGESFTQNPKILITPEVFGAVNAMSVSLLRMQNGDIGLFCILKYPDGHDEYRLFRSCDEANSFSCNTLCISQFFTGYYVINNSRILRCSGGRLIIPAAMHRYEHNAASPIHTRFDGRAVSYFYYSDTDGESWQEAPSALCLPHMTYSVTGLQEPGIAELGDGVLYAYFRTDLHVQYESFSYDNGLHWTAPQPSRFTSSVSPMTLRKNPYSNLYYAVWNPIPNYNGRDTQNSWGRTPLVLAKSADGLNFSAPQILEDDQSRGFCYAAMYCLDEKTALLAYCSGGTQDGCCLNRITIKKLML